MKRKLSLNGVKYIDEDNVIHLSKQIDSIDDLIELGNLYNPKKKYNIDLGKIRRIQSLLLKLKNMVGLHDIKKTIVEQILFFLQNFNDNNMLHTIVQGPPGVGKTMLACIIGEIYHKLDVFDTKTEKCKIVKAKRSDLIGEYLGSTAKKTQSVIDNCKGGVLIIDEAYSLGNSEGRDSFSKECIDTLNQNLSENKNNFLCIIAGYKDALNNNFFNYNEGLRRRFPFVYTIEKYNETELVEILYSLLNTDMWTCKKHKCIDNLIQQHYNKFENMGGDMETLTFNTKLQHSKRVLCLHKSFKNIITYEDIYNGMLKFIRNKTETSKQFGDIISHMYL